MADDFIPLNQSTPVQARWQGQGKTQNNQSGYQNNWQQRNQRRRGQYNRWGNNSQYNNSFGSDCNSSSYGHDNKSNIDPYLHPSMLKDPWEHLRQQKQ
ncbi:uncharacterized protein LOC123867154 [Maniola jurtina]|uniref:uncharacterized protein LOC123867154 n=1 Tax=Maniola jurtina TaxID=191418 RepID=UPI001E686E1B|nr:uncharacterized protein LOC123867154 [Maniola jurtina]